MTRLPLCLAAVCISLVLAGCDVDHYANLIEGTSDGTVTLALLESPSTVADEPASSSEEAAVVSSEQPPAVCENYVWRWMVYDCEGNYLYTME